MNQQQYYITSGLVSLFRYSHPDCVAHHDPPTEAVSYHSINFIERSDFSLRIGRRDWRIAPGTVFATSPGLVYSVRHAEAVPQDVTFVVKYQPTFADGLLREAQLKGTRLPPVSPLTNRLAYLYMLLDRVCANSGEVMAVETLAGELFDCVARGATSRAGRLFKRQQLAWYVERVEAARTLMETDYSAPHTLGSVARFTGMSPFHFARVFRELTGMPPHRYLRRVRLERAAERLRDGVSVTETCYASGFSNLSHFIRSFKCHFGVSPSRAAASSVAESLI